jgi:hypothetical protein
MKKKTYKRILWIAGLSLVLLLPLTVLPGLSYALDGPWGTAIEKTSRGFNNEFKIFSRRGLFSCYWNPGVESPGYWDDEGFSSTNGYYYFRLRSFELSVQVFQ